VLPYDSASVQLLGEGYLEIVGGAGWLEPDRVMGMRFPIPGDNPNTVVIERGRPHVLGDAPTAYPAFRQPPNDHIRSWLGVPLTVRDRVIGMLAVDRAEPASFTTDHVRLASAFADQVAIAIENARLYAEAEQRTSEMLALRAVMADISGELELPRLLEAVLQRAVVLLDATGGDLATYDLARRELVVAASLNSGSELAGLRREPGEGVLGRVAETSEPLLIPDYSTWEARSPEYANAGWHSVMAAPLLIGGQLVGVIGLAHTDPERRFQSSDLRLLIMFAQQAAIAIENARLFQQVQQLAITDGLTGLYNHRYLTEHGRREFDRARRYSHPLSAILLDLDNFKQVNDSHGHEVGNEVLKTIAARLADNVRDIDILARYGGEEFVVLLPENDLAGAVAAAHRLHCSVRDAPVPAESGPIPMTVSVGVALATPGMADLEALLNAADAAMYTAKQAGRDRVGIRTVPDSP
ncbi:MAG: sensor domain-containing diguanylate cyclase, partial [Chloroflexi bacterium]|nr:sensor domain-containing diguanylate cyclase [Chloroflexota bacterium]